MSSEDPNGCRPCECSPGGSIHNTCDPISGQCKCRPNMAGRTCDKPESGYFCPTLDQYMYEAEYAVKADDVNRIFLTFVKLLIV